MENKTVVDDIIEVFPESAKPACDCCGRLDDRLFLAKGLSQLFCEPCLIATKTMISKAISAN